MRVLFWYCDEMAWTPARQTLEDVPEAHPGRHEKTVAAFVHMEPEDEERASKVETKLVKNCKWLAGKWETKSIVLHSFTHLGEDKADPAFGRELLARAQARLETAGYQAFQTPYGYFLDLKMDAPGHPLARVYKQF